MFANKILLTLLPSFITEIIIVEVILIRIALKITLLTEYYYP